MRGRIFAPGGGLHSQNAVTVIGRGDAAFPGQNFWPFLGKNFEKLNGLLPMFRQILAFDKRAEFREIATFDLCLIEKRGERGGELRGLIEWHGSIPLADPRLQTRGVLVEVKGDATRLPIGQMLSAEVPAAEVAGADGVVLPRGALIRRDARIWAYVQTAPTVFVRRPVQDYKPIATGWFVGGLEVALPLSVPLMGA